MSLDVLLTDERVGEVFSANITHNLDRMARAAEIYHHVWRPEEIGIFNASQLVKPLRVAAEIMRRDPDRFQKFNAENGWGLYENFLLWLERYCEACEANPSARVMASR